MKEKQNLIAELPKLLVTPERFGKIAVEAEIPHSPAHLRLCEPLDPPDEAA